MNSPWLSFSGTGSAPRASTQHGTLPFANWCGAYQRRSRATLRRARAAAAPPTSSRRRGSTSARRSASRAAAPGPSRVIRMCASAVRSVSTSGCAAARNARSTTRSSFSRHAAATRSLLAREPRRSDSRRERRRGRGARERHDDAYGRRRARRERQPIGERARGVARSDRATCARSGHVRRGEQSRHAVPRRMETRRRDRAAQRKTLRVAVDRERARRPTPVADRARRRPARSGTASAD